MTRGHVTLLAAAVAVAGCYDLERLDPGPESHYLLIDDFEDGNGVPSASQFGSWRAAPFITGYDHPEELDVLEANDSAYALRAEFRLDYPNSDAYSGVSVGVFDARELLEGRVFQTFHFSARFVPSTPFPDVTEYYVQFGCAGAPHVPGVDGPFWIEHNVDIGPEWQAQSLSVGAFGLPSNVGPLIEGGPPACLAVVDNIRFTVSTKLDALDEPVSASLYIDDVYFE